MKQVIAVELSREPVNQRECGRRTFDHRDGDGAVLTSDSTLRFRTRAELADSLAAAGFAVDEVRDAPDRPGREFVFIARKSA